MTATEKKIKNIMRGIPEMSLESLIELVHESYFIAYFYDGEFSLKYTEEEDTGAKLWTIIDVENDKTYSKCFSIRECYELVYEDILEKVYEDNLREEREQEAREEMEAEERDRASLKKWLNEQGGVAYGRY